MNRKELYNEITTLGLKEEVKARFGKNYTMVSNENLQKVVDEAHKTLNAAAPGVICNALVKLVEILGKKKILLKSEIDAIMNA